MVLGLSGHFHSLKRYKQMVKSCSESQMQTLLCHDSEKAHHINQSLLVNGFLHDWSKGPVKAPQTVSVSEAVKLLISIFACSCVTKQSPLYIRPQSPKHKTALLVNKVQREHLVSFPGPTQYAAKEDQVTLSLYIKICQEKKTVSQAHGDNKRRNQTHIQLLLKYIQFISL